MKKVKKILLIILAVLGVVLLAAFAFLSYIKTRALPDYNENIQLSGISDDVEVLRDKHGIPHIYAKNEKDLYIAVGYVMAQDRLWQMDLLRRVTTGRLSEMFGEKTVKTDLLMRALRMPEKSKMVMDSLSPEILQSLEYFAEGVNEYIENNSGNLPPEFAVLGYKPEKWEAIHSINLIGYMAWDLTSGWKNEFLLKQLMQKSGEKGKIFIPNMPKQKSSIFPDFKLDSTLSEKTVAFVDQTATLEKLGATIFYGSNNWAVAGKKSTTGGAILSNDMHLGIFTPGIWYQMHLVIDGKLNVTGLAVPGAPHVIAGHNERIAWGMTNVMLDETDFYKETVNPSNENQYKLDGQWKDFKVKEEIIKVKDADDQKFTLKFTHRGPVVSYFKDEKDDVLSMRWLGSDYSNELRTLYLLNRAKNWADFRDAVKTFISVSQNVVYADVDGNIGLQTCAGLAIREGSGIEIYPGDTSLYDWKGIVPFEELPYTYNPECGYVASANNKTVGDDYPHYISYWFYPPYRYDRIKEMLESKEKLSVEDFKKMLADQKSHQALKFRKDIVFAVSSQKDLSKNEKLALDSLTAWNEVMDKNGISATLFDEFVIQFIKKVAIDELGEELTKQLLSSKIMAHNFVENVWLSKSEWLDDTKTTNKVETFENMVQLSFRAAIANLEKEYGASPSNWIWGDLHQMTLSHPMGSVKILDWLLGLNRGPFRVGGSSHTVSPYSYPLDGKYTESATGASHRHIYLPNNWDASQTIIPSGTSGIPASDFYCDQTQMYIDNQFHEDFITRPKVEAAAKFKMKFVKK